VHYRILDENNSTPEERRSPDGLPVVAGSMCVFLSLLLSCCLKDQSCLLSIDAGTLCSRTLHRAVT
jgi:hypothetical protein